MAGKTAGINVQDRNPYNVTVTQSGTLVGSDVELVYNTATVLNNNDLITCVENLLEFLHTAPGAGIKYGPP
jgi:hypothetical protein